MHINLVYLGRDSYLETARGEKIANATILDINQHDQAVLVRIYPNRVQYYPMPLANRLDYK